MYSQLTAGINHVNLRKNIEKIDMPQLYITIDINYYSKNIYRIIHDFKKIRLPCRVPVAAGVQHIIGIRGHLKDFYTDEK